MAQSERLGISLVLNTSRGFKFGNFSFQTPEIVGCYSVDSGCIYAQSLSGLKHLTIPKNETVKLDLNHVLEDTIKDDNSEHDPDMLEFIPKWIIEEHKKRGEWMQADFITFRSLLSMLMCTPYEKQKGWSICATKVNGSIFLFYKSKPKKPKRQLRSARKHKLQQYMTSDKPDSRPSTAETVSEENDLTVMFKSKLNEHSLIYEAKISGIESEEEVMNLEGANLIQLKTLPHLGTEGHYARFKRYQTINWWAQIYLAGAQKIVCGFYDRGVVKEIKCFEELELQEMGKGLWDARKCMSFCARFLSFVKNLLQKEDSPHAVWKFEWKPRENVTSARFESPTDLCFLPDWFLAHASSANTTANFDSQKGVNN